MTVHVDRAVFLWNVFVLFRQLQYLSSNGATKQHCYIWPISGHTLQTTIIHYIISVHCCTVSITLVKWVSKVNVPRCRRLGCRYDTLCSAQGHPLLLWGSRSITPGKFVKTQMLNPAFWWLLAVKFLAFWKLRPRSWWEGTNTLLVPNLKVGDQSSPVPTVVVPMF